MKRDALLEWKKITALATNALNVLSLRGFHVILEPSLILRKNLGNRCWNFRANFEADYFEILESREASSLKLPSLAEFFLVSKNCSNIEILIDQLFKIALIFTNLYDERT